MAVALSPPTGSVDSRTRQVNRLLTALSLTAVLITIERISPTTKVLLPPVHFLRLHEVLQMGLITPISIVISFALLYVLSDRFRLLADRPGLALGGLFLLGTYFYATGNGAHEVGSYLFGQYCGTHQTGSGICGSAYVDDYFFGNGVYFAGLFLSNLALVLLEFRHPGPQADSQQVRITSANAGILALTFIAYDGFDRVAVGLVSSLIFAVVFGGLLLRGPGPWSRRPFTLYSALGFTIAALVAIPIRIL